jgi:hypothetical protein
VIVFNFHCKVKWKLVAIYANRENKERKKKCAEEEEKYFLMILLFLFVFSYVCSAQGIV